MISGRSFIFLLLLLCFVILPGDAYAHNPGQSYVYLRIYEDSITGRYEINTEELNRFFGLSLERGLSKEDVIPHQPEIQKYILENSSFSSKFGDYKVRFQEPEILDSGNIGDFVQFNFVLEGVGEIPDILKVNYELFFKEDSTHQALLVIEYNWRRGIYGNESIPSLFFEPGNTEQELNITKDGSILRGFTAMIRMGIWHIWIGLDHILFLFALVLPSVLFLSSSRKEDFPEADSENTPEYFSSSAWKPVERFRPALINVIKIVTCFTIAHTITLSLAALEIIVLPSRLVESIIALSIALAALHNIYPVVLKKEWLIAFGFGLFHGFGFAGILAEKGFGGEFIGLTLLGFNLGVEIGQLFIICLMFPVLFLLRKTRIYPKILIYGSVLLIMISIYWFIERAFDTDLPLGGIILRFFGIL